MIVVIADDITGAAELAGMACSCGLRTEMLTKMAPRLPSCDVLVMATDTRSMTEGDAVACTIAIARQLAGYGCRLFKKTDSALRGHIMAEIQALLSVTDYGSVVFIPANPSKNRIIRQGVYYVDGVPIDETDFSRDPEFPAFSSLMTERFPSASEMGVIIPDVESMEDIRAAIDDVPEDTLLVGAADLFSVWLQGMGHVKQDAFKPARVGGSNIILVCGSTQSKAVRPDIPTSSMPLEVYDDVAPVSLWKEQAVALYEERHAIALNIPHRHLTGREVAVRLRGMMAEVVKTLVERHLPANLVIEGGATAYCCLKSLGWDTFHVIGEMSPGVVSMEATNGTVVTLKPGSYDWGLFM